MSGLRVMMLAAAFSLPAVAEAGTADALCATAEQSAEVRARWTAEPKARLRTVAAEVGISEAAVLSALPPEKAVGVAADAFPAVWQSLQAWPESLTVIVKAGQVFEVHGTIPPGALSADSGFFNLDPESRGITGHLRPDLYSAIYATSLPGRERVQHGVLFLDRDGVVIYGVYVPDEQSAEDSAVMAAFVATRQAMLEMSPACR